MKTGRARLGRRGMLVLAGAALGRVAWEIGGAATTPRPYSLTVATGSKVGVYYQYAQRLKGADDTLRSWSVLSTTGSLENLQLLRQDVAQLAFSAADAAADAYERRPAIKDLRALGRLYDDYMHLVVPSGSTLRTLTDLRGRAVSVGAKGSGTAFIADRLLGVAGLDPKRDVTRRLLSLDDSVKALTGGSLDAFFWSGGLPTMAITALSGARPIRLIDMSDAARLLRARFGPSYRIGAIPARTYHGNSASVYTAAVPNLLVTTAGLPTQSVCDLTSGLFAGAAEIGGNVAVAAQLDLQTAIFTEPIPLHPGAVDYYRSVAVYV